MQVVFIRLDERTDWDNHAQEREPHFSILTPADAQVRACPNSWTVADTRITASIVPAMLSGIKSFSPGIRIMLSGS
ncbi:hypothetical protein ACFQE1_00185 [Halobium palmae]|uniref:Uncharacterized protein n=1 Tax=Halobium palmae TaxID=1776492 RepID=A0ABD5RV73_9EURY